MALHGNHNGLYKRNYYIVVIIQIIIILLSLAITPEAKAGAVAYVTQQLKSNVIYNKYFNEPFLEKRLAAARAKDPNYLKSANDAEFSAANDGKYWTDGEKYTVPKGSTGTKTVNETPAESLLATVVTSPEVAVAEGILDVAGASAGLAVAAGAAAFAIGMGIGIYIESDGKIRDALTYEPITTLTYDPSTDGTNYYKKIIGINHLQDAEEYIDSPNPYAQYCAQALGGGVYCSRSVGEACINAARNGGGTQQRTASYIDYVVTSAFGGECRVAARITEIVQGALPAPSKTLRIKYEYKTKTLPVGYLKPNKEIYHTRRINEEVETTTTIEKMTSQTWEVRVEIKGLKLGENETEATIKIIKVYDTKGNSLSESLSYDVKKEPTPEHIPDIVPEIVDPVPLPITDPVPQPIEDPITAIRPKIEPNPLIEPNPNPNPELNPNPRLNPEPEPNAISVRSPKRTSIKQPKRRIPRRTPRKTEPKKPNGNTTTPKSIEWKCGISGKPACLVTGEPVETEEIEAPNDKEMQDQIRALIRSPLIIEENILPKHKSECPKIEMDLTSFLGKKFTADIHCELLKQHAEEIEKIALLGWLVIAVIIVLSA